MSDIQKGLVFGSARGVGDFPIGDGSFWETLHGFSRDDRGLLSSRKVWMPLIPDEWRGAQPPDALQERTLGMAFWRREGVIPEILILTTSGSWRFAPWRRYGGGANPGLEELQQWTVDGQSDVAPTGRPIFPASIVATEQRVYFTFGDRSGVWSWDGERILPVGFQSLPAPPRVRGPQANADGANAGGFSVPGRIGTTDGSWTDASGASVGGLDDGLWLYYQVNRHINGSYSPISPASAGFSLRRELASASGSPNDLRKGAAVHPSQGEAQTAARLILRTPNLRRLTTQTGQPQLLAVVENNHDHYTFVDELPDGELGPVWQEREPEPASPLLPPEFDGCLWRLNTAAHPSRAYFSERTAFGPNFGSILQGAWLDVHPSSGPITGALAIPWQGQATSVLLVFKETCVRVLSGIYPNYQEGSFAERGMPGPGLVQYLPDSAVIWFDGTTFRRYTLEGGAEDIGSPIRRKLRKIDATRAAQGVSYVQASKRQAVFVLPVRGADGVTYQFIWDYEAETWRTGEDIAYDAVLTTPSETLLIAGTLGGVHNVYMADSGRSTYELPEFEWTLRTAWLPMQDGPLIDTQGVLARLVVMAEEVGVASADVLQYKDFDGDNPVLGTVQDDTTQSLPGFDTRVNKSIPTYDAAVYDEDVWRTPRIYTYAIPSNGIPGIVFQIGVTGTGPLSLLTVYGYGRGKLGQPGTRPITPTT